MNCTAGRTQFVGFGYKTRGTERVPLFGPQELMNQLGVQEYARERKFRERLNAWLKVIELYWPECPAVLARNGSFLVLEHALAVRNAGTERLLG